MRLSLLCFLFITTLSVNAQLPKKEEVVTLPPAVADFFLDAYYKGQRDSILLRSAHLQEQDMLAAIALRTGQLESCRRDSASSKLYISSLNLQKKNSVDSVKTVGDAKVEKVQKRSTTKSWIIIGLVILFALK